MEDKIKIIVGSSNASPKEKKILQLLEETVAKAKQLELTAEELASVAVNLLRIVTKCPADEETLTEVTQIIRVALSLPGHVDKKETTKEKSIWDKLFN